MNLLKKFTGIIIFLFLAALLVVLMLIKQNNNKFDETIFNPNLVDKHIEELTSEKYLGKMAGTEGNELALKYIEEYFTEIGIDPAGIDGTYYQQFSMMTPEIDTQPIFTIKNSENETIRELKMYKDYKAVSNMNGGGIDFTGEMIFLGNDLLRINKEELKDRIVVTTSNILSSDKINYVIQNGGRGILCNADILAMGYQRRYELEKELSTSGKTGETIFAGYIEDSAYQDIIKYAEEITTKDEMSSVKIIKNAEIKISMGFPIIDSANILGKIEGKSSNGRTLLITANIDGSGEGTDGMYFPGAISNTSGLAVMMETARVMANQKNLPYETVVFIGFNGQQQQLCGSEYYIEHPVYPIETTTIIHIEDIGIDNMEGLKISSDNLHSSILKDKISNYASDAGFKTEKTGPVSGVARRFADKNAAAVMLSDVIYMQDIYSDTYDFVDPEYTANATKVLMNYIKREVYHDTAVDYLSSIDIVLLVIILIFLLFNLFITKMFKINPSVKIGNYAVENIYYSTLVVLLRKIIQYMTPVFIAVFLLVFLGHIDPKSNIGFVNNEITTNFSGYLTLKNTILYFKNIFNSNSANENIAKTVLTSSGRSLILMLSSLILSTAIGIFRGLYEGYKSKRKNLRSLGTLVVFSIPDVLVVLTGLLVYVFIAKNFTFLGDVTFLRKFILPLITLSIIPTIYISRITYITVQDEIKLEYIRNARAKGLPRKKIFTSEILPTIIFKIVDTLPTIITMLFTNMIIVEYLFNYLGILNYLIYFYNRQNVNGFVILALTLGVIFVLLTWGVQSVAKYINPLKRRVDK